MKVKREKPTSLLSRKDIQQHGPQFIRESSKMCDCSKVDRSLLHFTLKCVTDLLRDRNHLRLSKKNTTSMKEILTPYKKEYLALSTPHRRGYYVGKLRNQHGSGVFTAILGAVIPIITSLVSRLLNKGKKK